MDEIVLAAMLKWPGVPDCFGWLGLDHRGQWFMRDEKAQREGNFQTACDSGEQTFAKGSKLCHEGLIAFIGRNYKCHTDGRWYFQNGPQRVFVELATTPWVWRIGPLKDIRSHTGELVKTVFAILVDDAGRVYLNTELGLGLVHSQDMFLAAERVSTGEWRPENVKADDLPTVYSFMLSPEGANKSKKRQGEDPA